MLVFDNVPLPPLELPGLSVMALPVGTGTAKYDLTLALAETREGLSGSLEYSADLFDAPTVARLGGDFLDLLEKVVADPGLRLSDLPPRTRERRQEVRLRGYLIDPAEIEAALLRRPEVGQAVVVVREDAPGERRLVAYAAPRTPGQAALDADALRRGLREILPGYMVPETT